MLVSIRDVRIWRVRRHRRRRARARVRRRPARSARSGSPTSLLFVGLLAVGALMIYCFWLLISTLAFWIVNVWEIAELFEGIYQTGRFPVSIYPALAAVRRDLPRPDRVRDHGSGRGGDLAARLGRRSRSRSASASCSSSSLAAGGGSGSGSTRAPRPSRSVLRVVGAELLAEGVADLADRAAARAAPRASAAAGCPCRPRRGAPRRAPPRPSRRSRSARTRRVRSTCRASPSRVEPVQLDLLGVRLDEPVDADDDPLARLDLARVAERRLLDLALDEPLLDRRDRAAELVDALDQLPRALLELVGERLDEERAAERVGRVGGAGLVREELLRPQRDPAPTARSAARAPRRSRSCAGSGRRRPPPRAPGSRPGRCCSPAAGRSGSSRPSARGSAAPAPAGSSRRSGRA